MFPILPPVITLLAVSFAWQGCDGAVNYINLTLSLLSMDLPNRFRLLSESDQRSICPTGIRLGFYLWQVNSPTWNDWPIMGRIQLDLPPELRTCTTFHWPNYPPNVPSSTCQNMLSDTNVGHGVDQGISDGFGFWLKTGALLKDIKASFHDKQLNMGAFVYILHELFS